MSLSDRLYEKALDFEWRTGIPFVVLIIIASVIVSILAIVISLTT